MAKKKRPTPQELAGKTFTVRVTRKDILKGKPQSTHCCPIALALKRATGVQDVEVDGDSIKVDGLANVDAPAQIENFVSAFDDVRGTEHFDDGKHRPALKRVRPFRFRLTLPVPEVVQEAQDGDIEIL